MEDIKKDGRYSRIYEQLATLVKKSNNTQARMATIVAVLHHKMEYFFWTGFYLLDNGEMTVNIYQGPVACQILEKNKGVCWAAFNKKETIVVEDVHQFPGHIACSSASRSEIVVPILVNETVVAVLDVDSEHLNSFDTTDARYLTIITELLSDSFIL